MVQWVGPNGGAVGRAYCGRSGYDLLCVQWVWPNEGAVVKVVCGCSG